MSKPLRDRARRGIIISRISRRKFVTRRAALLAALAVVSAPYVLRNPAYGWMHPGAPIYDTWLAVAMGDSNNGSGQYFNASYDTTSPTVFQIEHTTGWPVIVAQEPLNQLSMSANEVGPHTKLAQLLVANGRVPANIQRIIIIPNGWAGTGLSLVAGNTGYWNVNGSRQALDATNGLYATIDAAKAAYPNSQIAYFNWIEGANDGSWNQAAWTAAMQALFAEIRSRYPDSVNAPVLVTGIPPDRTNTSLGYQVNLAPIIAGQQAIAANLTRSIYIDPSAAPVLHSYLDNGFVHFNAASHRGGIPNINTTPYLWNSGTAYTPAGSFLVQKCVVASDGFIYTCISSSTGVDPSGNANPTFWSQQWDTTAAVSATDCLAYRQYQGLLSMGF